MRYDFDAVHDRRGTYCTQWDYTQDRFGKSGILPFSISDTDFLSPDPVVRSVSDMVQRGLYGYTRWNHHDYKGSISRWFSSRFDTFVDEDWVIYSPSVMYSSSLLIRLLTRPGDGVLTLSPMYDSFPGVIEGNGRRMVSSALVSSDPAVSGHSYMLDMNDLETRANECSVLLLCSPHNPTGRLWTAEEMMQILELCRKNDLYLITDEIHMDLTLKGGRNIPAVSLLEHYDRIVTCSSASKVFNTPALGGSYVLVPDPELRARFLDQTRHVDFLNSPTLASVYATMAGYNECQDYVDQLTEYVAGNMSVLKRFTDSYAPNLKFSVPEATYLAWIDVRELGVTSDELQNSLVNVGGVGIMRGETYGPQGRGYLRMCIGCPRSKLEEGLERVSRALGSLGVHSRANS